MSERTLRFLHALPDVAPPAGLWQRIARVQSRRRWARRGGMLAAAAVVVVGVLLMTFGLREPPMVAQPSTTVSPRDTVALDEMITRSHALERDLASARPTGSATQSALSAELARVDAELLRAYARDAGDRELHALWRARIAALESLVAAHRHPDAIRI